MTTTNNALILLCLILITDALLPPLTFPKDLTNEQLVMMLTNHPILMGADYHHDIQRLIGMLLRLCTINLTHDQSNYNSDYRSQIRWK